jgi:hypothetical protein
VNEQRGRERSLANLVPFRHGQSGNPKGKAPDPLLKALRKKLTAGEAAKLTDVLLEKAGDGDMKALEMIWDRIAGKAVARQEQGEPGAFSRGFEIRLVRVGNDGDDETAEA